MIIRILFAIFFLLFSAKAAFPADMESRVNTLEEALKKQQKMMEEQQGLINRLKEEALEAIRRAPEKAEESVSLDPKKEKDNSTGGKGESLKVSGAFGGFFKNLKNPALTFTLNSFYYTSSLNERQLKNRGITGFSSIGLDQTKGFNIDEGSISVFAPVDQYLDLFGVISFKEEGSSIEEAYFYTKCLPAHLRFKAGKFKSNFSVHNEMHPHDWNFVDAPLIYQGFMGRDGVMEKGAQLTFRPELPLSPLFGVELLQGQNPILFNQSSSGGPHAFTAYVKGTHNFNETSSMYFGPYVVSGRTETDSAANGTLFKGNSTIYGFETLYKWTPSKDRSFTLHGEYMWRKQSGDLANLIADTLDRLSRSQDGAYIQALYQIDKWRVGARYDRLNIFTNEFSVAGTQQSFHNPWRLTGALEYNPSEFTRFRLQYNYDRSGGGSLAYGGGPETNHEIYLQMVLSIGAHMEPKGQWD
jgi:hypothetical protein